MPREPVIQRSAARTRFIDLLWPGAVFVFCTLPFCASIWQGFSNWDDPANILENEAIRGLSAAHFRWFFASYWLGVYEPLSWMLKAAVYVIAGLRPGAYHGVSVFLHGCNAVLLFAVARRVLERVQPLASEPARRVGAATAVLLFGTHPLRTEVVAWASGQPYVLAAFFSLLTTWIYLLTFSPVKPSLLRRLTGISAATLTFLCAVWSKAAAVPLVVVLLVLDIYPLGRLRRGSTQGRIGRCLAGLLAEKTVMWVIIADTVHWAMTVFSEGISDAESNKIDLFSRMQIAGHAVLFYPLQTLWPHRLSPHYPLSFPFSGVPGRFLVVGICAAIVTLLVVLNFRRVPGTVAAWIIYLLWLAPVCGMAQHGDQYAADRYTYLSEISLMIVVGGVSTAKWDAWTRTRRRAYAIAAAAVLVLLSLASVRQTRYWRSNVSLWTHALDVDPSDCAAHNNLADGWISERNYAEARRITTAALRRWPAYSNLHFTKGYSYDLEGRLGEALPCYAQAFGIDPQGRCAEYYASVLVRLGRKEDAVRVLERHLAVAPDDVNSLLKLAALYSDAGHADKAVEVLQSALAHRPKNALLWMRLGLAEMDRRRWDVAETMMRRAIQINPALPGASYHLAYIYSETGRKDQAIAAYETAIHTEPGRVEIRVELAAMLGDMGRDAEAVAQLQESLKIAPEDASAMRLVAWLLATSHDGALRNADEAMRWLDRVRSKSPKPDAFGLLASAAALGELGRFDEAMKRAEEAARVADVQDKDLARRIAACTQALRSGRPYRR